MWFAVGFVMGVFSLICMVLCQAQKSQENREEVYFAASTETEDEKLFLNKDGTWGAFSLSGTKLVSTVKEINVGAGVGIEKIGVSIRFIQGFK